eukprot:6468762-Amphidinium_carterae.1
MSLSLGAHVPYTLPSAPGVSPAQILIIHSDEAPSNTALTESEAIQKGPLLHLEVFNHESMETLLEYHGGLEL